MTSAPVIIDWMVLHQGEGNQYFQVPQDNGTEGSPFWQASAAADAIASAANSIREPGRYIAIPAGVIQEAPDVSFAVVGVQTTAMKS